MFRPLAALRTLPLAASAHLGAGVDPSERQVAGPLAGDHQRLQPLRAVADTVAPDAAVTRAVSAAGGPGESDTGV